MDIRKTSNEGEAFAFWRDRLFDDSDWQEGQGGIGYGDAFVAFLNRLAIARSGGLTAPFPAYTALSAQQHDAQIPEGGASVGLLQADRLNS